MGSPWVIKIATKKYFPPKLTASLSRPFVQLFCVCFSYWWLKDLFWKLTVVVSLYVYLLLSYWPYFKDIWYVLEDVIVCLYVFKVAASFTLKFTYWYMCGWLFASLTDNFSDKLGFLCLLHTELLTSLFSHQF